MGGPLQGVGDRLALVLIPSQGSLGRGFGAARIDEGDRLVVAGTRQAVESLDAV